MAIIFSLPWSPHLQTSNCLHSKLPPGFYHPGNILPQAYLAMNDEDRQAQLKELETPLEEAKAKLEKMEERLEALEEKVGGAKGNRRSVHPLRIMKASMISPTNHSLTCQPLRASLTVQLKHVASGGGAGGYSRNTAKGQWGPNPPDQVDAQPGAMFKVVAISPSSRFKPPCLTVPQPLAFAHCDQAMGAKATEKDEP